MKKPVFIMGPCVLESPETAFSVADYLSREFAGLREKKFDVEWIFKSSFLKDNRTRSESYRGPGIREGLSILKDIGKSFDLKVLTDIHESSQAEIAAEIVDVLQIPAFLCRQTSLLEAAGETGLPVNIKKGQFLSPWDMKNVVEKIRGCGGKKLMLVERGASFGYNNLVVDMRSLPIMRSFGCPVIFDGTHSVQLPGGSGGVSAGQREFIEPLAKAATAVGIDGLFMEIHPDPDKAFCDGPNSIPLGDIEKLLRKIVRIHEAAG